MSNEHFSAYLVEDTADGVRGSLQRLPSERLPAGDVLIRVQWSSLNYKDALAATGHPGVVRQLPHVPGIDAAGIVESSSSSDYQAGDRVLVTGYELGQSHWGAWAEYVRVPSSWIVPQPPGLTAREAMILGTAGFTAAQCVMAIQRNEVGPEMGEVVVTGATGGVGSLSVRLLAKLGYRVVAVTGKKDWHEQLRRWGAARVMDRSEVCDTSERPMLRGQWAGGVDTVGGVTLATLLRSTRYGGCIAACGLVGGAELQMSVYPFLLRGVTLAGVASADCPYPRRLEIWNKLAGEWRLSELDSQVTEVPLDDVDREVRRILNGEQVGRVIVRIGA